jgi:hypothetical protein
MHWGQMTWPKRGLLVFGALGVLGLVILGSAAIWTDATAVQVTFINNSANTAILPDCSTDLVSLAPGVTTALPIAWDHPKECSVEYLTRSGDPSSFACVVMPSHLGSQTVVKLSDARPSTQPATCG